MGRIPDTGGPLNHLNGWARVSAPGNSVPVMALIRRHRPRSPAELAGLIAEHARGECPCGIVSRGSIEDFGRALYDAQFRLWGEARFTLRECVQWEYDLFVLQSLKGDTMEVKAASELSALLGPGFAVLSADVYLDCELRVDLEVLWRAQRIAGVQVKPESYAGLRRGLRLRNERGSAFFDVPVFVLLYRYEDERLLGLRELASELRGLAA